MDYTKNFESQDEYFHPDKYSKDEKLTPEQIENWRKVLTGMFGPYATLMSDEQVQNYKDKMQAAVNEEYVIIEVVETDTMLFLNGKDKSAFRCSCKCNVFRKVICSDDKLRYRCNACGDIYLAEK
jgi:hypothetical protein